MKRARLVSLIVICLSTSQSLLAADTRELGDRSFERDGNTWTQIDPNGLEYEVVPDVINVKFRAGVSDAEQAGLHPALGSTRLHRAITGWVDVRIPAGQDVFEPIDNYLANRG